MLLSVKSWMGAARLQDTVRLAVMGKSMLVSDDEEGRSVGPLFGCGLSIGSSADWAEFSVTTITWVECCVYCTVVWNEKPFHFHLQGVGPSGVTWLLVYLSGEVFLLPNSLSSVLHVIGLRDFEYWDVTFVACVLCVGE
jgi:hypothetical protein